MGSVIYYGGYKIEKTDVGWNIFQPYRIKGEGKLKWHWLWCYGSWEEAKEAIDNHNGNKER